MKEKINFVSKSNDNLATYRWRVKLPAYGLDLLDNIDCTISEEGDERADINVFQKHFNIKNDADFVTRTSSKTVFDISDDHFDRTDGTYYEYMCQNCDEITCPTDRMQERIYECTGRLAQIIPDPISFNRGGHIHSANPRFLWFGHRVNLASIYKWINKVPHLTIVTNAELIDLPDHCEFVPWAPGVVEDIIDEFDIVLLPSNDAPWARTKSPNRAVDSIWAGKFVITDFEEVYEDLQDYLFLGDIYEGIDFYHNNRETVERMIEAGQDFVEENYSSDVVIGRWAEVLSKVKKGV